MEEKRKGRKTAPSPEASANRKRSPQQKTAGKRTGSNKIKREKVLQRKKQTVPSEAPRRRQKPDTAPEGTRRKQKPDISPKEAPRRHHRGRYILYLLLLLLLLFLAAVLLGNLETVTIEGNELYEESVIKDAVLNDDYSWNTFYVFLKYKFVETDPLPFIDTMEVEITGPASLNIHVYEKGLLGYLEIEDGSGYAYFDKDGIVEEVSETLIAGVPQIEGLTCESAAAYEILPIESQSLKNLLTLTQALKRYDLVPDVITYGVTNAPRLTYGNIRVTLGGNSDLTPKLERMAAIMPKISSLSGILHMENWSQTNSTIVFSKDEDDTEVRLTDAGEDGEAGLADDGEDGEAGLTDDGEDGEAGLTDDGEDDGAENMGEDAENGIDDGL